MLRTGLSRGRSIVLVMAAVAILSSAEVRAQDNTSGAISGQITDSEGAPVAGATVVVSSPALQGTRSEVTGDAGTYYLANLPPGTFLVTVYFGEASWQRQGAIVQLGKVTRVSIPIDPTRAGGETIVLSGKPPVIDQGSAKVGVTITEDYARNVPTGTTYQDVIEAEPSAQGDFFGGSFGGSTSPENAYVVDGLNVTDPVYGGATNLFQDASTTTNLPNEFVREVEVITGGYGAEHGRATGSVVNVVTKSGGNELSGTVFAYFTPGTLSPSARTIDRDGSAIARQDELSYELSTGAELGGPIIRDRLWFHAGINPVVTAMDVHRIVNSFRDEDGDGVPDLSADTGFAVTDEVGRSTLTRTRETYMFTGKLTGAVSPDHQGALSIFGSPGTQDTLRRVTGREESNRLTVDDGALDLAAKWSSKLNDNRTQIDFVAGLHRTNFEEIPYPGGDIPQINVDEGQLSDFAAFEPGGSVPAQCMDGGPDDPYPLIDNCPVTFYDAGGLGFIETLQSDRMASSIKLTQRFQAAGHHQAKIGFDGEYSVFDRHSAYTGGLRMSYSPERYGDVLVRGFFKSAADGEIDCGRESLRCQYAPDGVEVDTSTRSLSWFAQDTWSPLPNLSLEAGVRWEQQTLYAAEQVAGLPAVGTGETIPEVAFSLDNLWAPRLSAIYDWTGEGRSKIYGHWGRYYQAIPLSVASQAFGGEVSGRAFYDLAACSSWTDPTKAACPGFDQSDQQLSSDYFGGDLQLVVPEVEGQYLDQLIAGVEYELWQELKVGAAYIRRDLGRIIEDVSPDFGASTVISNPGEAVDQEVIDQLRAEAQTARDAGDVERADFLDHKADSFAIVGQFDRPERLYQALQLTASKRFSEHVMLRGSYTYSATTGNVAGMIQPENGINGLTPNFGSAYDLLDLMTNQYGRLPQDRPHVVKLDGYYTTPIEPIGIFTFGLRLRASSGVPYDVRGTHHTYGVGDTLILPRGDGGRTPVLTQIDSKITYGRRFGGTLVEGFLDVFNLFNQQTATAVDDLYTFDEVDPISGGDAEDLAHAKARDRDGRSTGRVVEKNPNYENALYAQLPLEVRFGVRLTF